MLKNSALNTIGNVAFFGFQWLITIIVANVLGLEDAGIYSLSISYANMFVYFANYGMRNYQLSDSNNEYSQNDYLSTRIVLITVSTIAFIIMLFSSDMNSYTRMCCVAYYIFQIGTVLFEHILAVFQKADQYKPICVSYFIKGILPFIGFCVFCVLTKDLMTSIFVMAVLYFLSFFYDSRKLNSDRFQFSVNKTKSLLIRCFPLMILSIIATVFLYLARNSIQSSYGSTVLGGYSTITMVVTVVSVFVGAIFSTFIVHFATMKDQRQVLRGYLKLLGLFVLVSIAIIVICHLFLPTAFHLIYGAKVEDYLYLSNTAVILSLVMTFNSLNQTILIAQKKNKPILYANIVGFIVYVFIYQSLLVRFGLIGCNFGLIIAYLIISLLEMIVIFMQKQTLQC